MLAQGITNPVIGELGKPGEGGGIFFSRGLPAAIGLIFVIGSLIFFFMLVWGAITWISSGGDKQALEGARGRITSALVGLVLLFAALAIIKFIESFFGINILTLDIGPLRI